MKKTLVCLLVILGVASLLIAGVKDKLTLKEKIDNAGEVKIYFSNYDIGHNPNTKPPQGSTNGGTGCPKFDETTPLPQEYADAAVQVVEVLNREFKTTAFIAGDISTVPVTSTIAGFNNYDWLGHGDQLFAHVITMGEYTVTNSGLMGEIDLSNSLLVTASLNIYEIVEGKLKMVGTKAIAWVSTKKVETAECDDYAYFVKNFPATSVVEPFKTAISKKTADFAQSQMKKYDRAMKKKKK